MKKILILITIASSSINCMYNAPDDWNAKSYEDHVAEITTGYAIDAIVKSKLLTSSDKTILDIGCGTGNTAYELVQQKLVQQIHGIDSSKNMIDFAQNKYCRVNNLTFARTPIEEFNAAEKYDAAIMFFCLNGIKDKSHALTKINQALKDNGEFFGIIRTYPASKLEVLLTRDRINVLRKRMKEHKELINNSSFLTDKEKLEQTKSIAREYRQKLEKIYKYQDPTSDEFKKMLINNGFEIISYETKDLTLITTKEHTIKDFLWSLTFYNPFIQSLPRYKRKDDFMHYINNYIKNIEQPAHTVNNQPQELKQCRSDLKQSRKKQCEDNRDNAGKNNDNNDSNNICPAYLKTSPFTKDDEIVLSSSIENADPEFLAALQEGTLFGDKTFYIAPLINNTIVFHVRKIKTIDETNISESNEK